MLAALPSRLPAWARVRQPLSDAALCDVRAAVEAEVRRLAGSLRGRRVAVAVGSRGIDRIDQVVVGLVGVLREAGARPVVVPAMGSHGGATAEGQVAVLASLGVTVGALGCPIDGSMAVSTVAEAAGRPVVTANAGGGLVIPVGRIKPHTGFRGPIESGLCKLLVVGLGKREGAASAHQFGYDGFSERLQRAAEALLGAIEVPFGLALIEDARGRLARIEAVPGADLLSREPALLDEARARMGRLPVEDLDVLIVDAIGKDVSGVGMDPNVIGRDHRGPRPGGPIIRRIVVRGLTPATGGNANGIGLADVALEAAVERMDGRLTWTNCVTAGTLEASRIPVTARDEREALAVALACLGGVPPERARILRIADTKHLEWLQASEALWPELIERSCDVGPGEPIFPSSRAVWAPLAPPGCSDADRPATL